MSKEVNTTWECYACEGQNPVWIVKPNSLIPTVKTVHCEVCESRFQLRFLKVRGTHEISYECIRDWLSPAGKKMVIEKENQLPAPNVAPATP